MNLVILSDFLRLYQVVPFLFSGAFLLHEMF